jgi:hypothetical protein
MTGYLGAGAALLGAGSSYAGKLNLSGGGNSGLISSGIGGAGMYP